jgi:transcriptional regulator with XRE-family HTH domain
MGSPRLTKANKQAISERLRAAREVAGYSMRKVADGTGVSPPAVAGWERGTVPDAEHRAALAELYEIDESVLFVEIESRLDAARELLRRPA